MKLNYILKLTLIALVLYATGCEEKVKPAVVQIVDAENLPQQESWNSKIVVSDSGRIIAVIFAGHVMVYEHSQKIDLNGGIEVHFYDRKGQQTSILTSEKGLVYESTNNLEAHKNVVVVSSDSSIMKTEHLFWDNNRRLIYTPEYVDITTKTEKIHGHGFESDENLKDYRIYRVTGRAKAE